MPFAGRLVDLVTHDMRLAKNLAFARLKSNSLMITDVGRHLFSKGGKSLRAMLALASARMCGHRDGYHIPIAVAVEFIHAATLLHDDVIDDADLRRGGVSAHKIWGNRTSILAGDFLLGQAFQLMVEVGSIDVLSILSDAAVVIAEAEAMQIAVIENMSITEDEYFSVVCAKTAALFAAAAEVGPALSG